jgi:hypothetical protein
MEDNAMKAFMKTLLAGGALLAAASTTQAAVISINVFDDAPAAEALFISKLHSHVTEDFESLPLHGFEQSTGSSQLRWVDTAKTFQTSVGDFTLVTPGGTNDGDTWLSEELKIENASTGEDGREVASGNWLDSNDAKKVQWDISIGGSPFNAIGFYLADANDQGARLILRLTDGTEIDATYQLTTALPNGNIKYITINSDVSISSASLIFDNGNTSLDGWGIDNVTVGQVPEPGTLLLLGLGLLGLGAARRRMRS